MLAAVALAAFLAAMVVIALSSALSDGNGSAATTTATVTVSRETAPPPEATTVRRPPARVPLAPVGVYDPPPGDGHENDSAVPNAVDGDPSTVWSTEHYTNGFAKPGVGIVLDAGRRRAITRVVVGTELDGSRAEIMLGDTPGGPFRLVSKNRLLGRATTFDLRRAAAGRYLVVWITRLSPAVEEAHVTKVRALVGS